MMKELERVYELTVEMKQLFDSKVTAKNREEIIEKLNERIEERGKWMEKLSPPYTEEERELGERIFSINVGIEENMQRLFGDLKGEMKQMQKQRKSQQSYSNPYRHIAVSDGTFLDKKN